MRQFPVERQNSMEQTSWHILERKQKASFLTDMVSIHVIVSLMKTWIHPWPRFAQDLTYLVVRLGECILFLNTLLTQT